MKENYTKGVQKILKYSKDEAIRLGHTYVGSEHFLLGIIKDKNGNGNYDWWEDGESELMDRVHVRIRYKTDLIEFYSRPNYSYRIIFIPETIGSLTYLRKNLTQLL